MVSGIIPSLYKQKGQINLSFLDTLSCSLGGMIMLFFIFATLSHEGARTLEEPEEISKAKQKAAHALGGNPAANDRPTLHLAEIPLECKLKAKAGMDQDIKIIPAKTGYLLLVQNPKNFQDSTIEFENCPNGYEARLVAKRASVLDSKSFTLSTVTGFKFTGFSWEKEG